VERARYEAERAERQYRAVEPETDSLLGASKQNGKNVYAISLLPRWNCSGGNNKRPRALSQEEKNKSVSLGSDLKQSLDGAYTTDRDRKELLRTLMEEVIVYRRSPRTACSSHSALARRHSI